MKNKIFAIALAALLPISSLMASEILNSRPVDKSSLSDLKLSLGTSAFERQSTTVFNLAKNVAKEKWHQVDIKPFCNVNIFGKGGLATAVHFLFSPTGKVTYYGVPFNIIVPSENDNRDAIGMASSYMLPTVLPTQVKVPIGKKIESLFFLHSSYYTIKGSDYKWIVAYADGSSGEIPYRATIDTGDWWHPYTRIWEENTKCVLVPAQKDSKTSFRNMHATQWKNPSPEKKIASITFNSNVKMPMGYFIYAITAVLGQ